jgi:hypothetical protein
LGPKQKSQARLQWLVIHQSIDGMIDGILASGSAICGTATASAKIPLAFNELPSPNQKGPPTPG